MAITPESATELAAAVRRMAADPALCERLGQDGATYVREHFDRSRLAAAYLDFLQHTLTVSQASRLPSRSVEPYGKRP